jgi:hypothetical protein
MNIEQAIENLELTYSKLQAMARTFFDMGLEKMGHNMAVESDRVHDTINALKLIADAPKPVNVTYPAISVCLHLSTSMKYSAAGYGGWVTHCNSCHKEW